jgi:hypothetical protein
MAKTSCLIHAPNSRVVLLRDDFLRLCENNLPAAVLLSLIEHTTNFQLELIERVKSENEERQREGLPLKQQVDEWIYRTRDAWIAESMGLLKLHDFKSGMSFLEQRAFVSRRRHPDFRESNTRQIKLNIEAVNKAIIELINPTGTTVAPTVTGDRSTVTGDRSTVTGDRSIKECADSLADSYTDSIAPVGATDEPAQQKLICSECESEDVTAYRGTDVGKCRNIRCKVGRKGMVRLIAAPAKPSEKSSTSDSEQTLALSDWFTYNGESGCLSSARKLRKIYGDDAIQSALAQVKGKRVKSPFGYFCKVADGMVAGEASEAEPSTYEAILAKCRREYSTQPDSIISYMAGQEFQRLQAAL